MVQTLAAEIEESPNQSENEAAVSSSGLEGLFEKRSLRLKLRKKHTILPMKTEHIMSSDMLPYGPQSLRIEQKHVWLVVQFPLDLMAPNRRIGIALVLLACFASVAAWGLARWSISPLEEAAEAMQKIADGDLSHRVVNRLVQQQMHSTPWLIK